MATNWERLDSLRQFRTSTNYNYLNLVNWNYVIFNNESFLIYIIIFL